MQAGNIKGKKILITGINGFVGGNLAKKLKSQGADVYGVSRSVEEKNKILKANILDFSKINEFIRKTKIEICFHLAGEALVETGQIDPFNTFKVNIEGTLNILESARKNNIGRVIISSTSHVYGKNRVPYFEGYTPRPSRPYETSKACMDLIAQSYNGSFNLPVLIPRFVNIYGPKDLNFNRLIPKTIRAVLSDEDPTMWGGNVIRDYLFIDDAVNAYILLAGVDLEKIGENKIFNFGGGNNISVEDLIKKIISLSDKKLKIKKISEERPLEINQQYVSLNKASKILGWKNATSLDEGLKKTIDWYRSYFGK
ncbi:MAG: NAD(P)-dependent oxidoreductase [Candidatus Levyibacteriota bacterium]